MGERLPSKKEALNFLVQSGCSPNVIKHCKTVSAFAVRMAKACRKKGLNVNVQLVEISALLHDIGRSRTHGVHHALVGAEIARSLDLPNSVTNIIERHAGGGIPRNEAKQLGWPVRDYLPKTLEEKIVNYADKRVEGLRIVPIEQTLKKFSRELGASHPSIGRIKRLHHELSNLIGDF